MNICTKLISIVVGIKLILYTQNEYKENKAKLANQRMYEMKKTYAEMQEEQIKQNKEMFLYHNFPN